jgi:hypothetical protein
MEYKTLIVDFQILYVILPLPCALSTTPLDFLGSKLSNLSMVLHMLLQLLEDSSLSTIIRYLTSTPLSKPNLEVTFPKKPSLPNHVNMQSVNFF